MRRILAVLTVVGAACVGGSCTSAPKETVELSEIIDQQIAQMQVSHEGFVRLYYASLRGNVESFMEERWIPTFLNEILLGNTQQEDPESEAPEIDLSGLEGNDDEDTVSPPAGDGGGDEPKLTNEERFRRDLDRAYRLSKIDWKTVVDTSDLDPDLQEAVTGAIQVMVEVENANLGQVMMNFSRATQKQINERRASLLRPIDDQEAMVLEKLREGYADLQRGSATIKAYLASVVKLAEERDAVAEKLGILDAQRGILENAMRASERAASALTSVKNNDEAIGEFLSLLGGAGD